MAHHPLMRLPIYQIDAFSGQVFRGNPAAVVPLESWLPDATLQSIANENNLAETAFFVPEGEGWRLRWFTPAVEVDLCGHATLASAHLIFSRLKPGTESASFQTKSGVLRVTREGDLLALDFPALRPKRENDESVRKAVESAIGNSTDEIWRARDLLALLPSAAAVRRLKPNFDAVTKLDTFGLIVTAPGDEPGVDFISRFFAPAKGVPEDPATGSAHCMLTPFWAERLGRPRLTGHQVSARGGRLTCTDRGERVTIAGQAVLYLEGTIEI
jgi:PhzF family phenazine biosynthesis protein